MALQVQTFTNFSHARWEAFKDKIKTDTGVDLIDPVQENEPATGTVKHGSFEFMYKYDPATEVLTIQCLKKPLFIPASAIINGITEEIADLKV